MSHLSAFSEALKRARPAPSERPETLFHYTTAGGFAGIVQSGVIRATNFSFMNDPLEVVHGQSLISSLLSDSLRRHNDPLVRRVLEGALERLTERGAGAEIYVSCFTTMNDDLSQWRWYGAGTAARYALEFRTAGLHEATLVPRQYKVRFSKVLYDEALQRAKVQMVLDAAANFMIENQPSDAPLKHYAAHLFRRLARMLPTLKAPSYAAEAEWRIVLLKPANDVSELEFDTSRGVIRSYVKFPLRVGGTLPLESVIVLAPTYKTAAEKAARLVLNYAKTPAEVRGSRVSVADF